MNIGTGCDAGELNWRKMKYAIGVDMGGTAVKIGAFGPDGSMLDKTVIPTKPERGKDRVFDDIASAVRGLAEKNALCLADCGIGIGFPGAVDRNGHANAAVDLKMFDICPGRELSSRLNGHPVAAENDANAAAIGEMWQGGGKGFSDLILITIGTGIGSGVIIDKKIVHGAHGLAGEIGHIQIDPDETEYCNCGGRGCLDQIASATGIVRIAKRFLARNDSFSMLREMENFTAKAVADAAKRGDAPALESLTYCMDRMGKMIAAVGNVIDPEAVVIGGGVSKAGPFLVDLIFECYKKYPTLTTSYPVFRLAELSEDAGMYGAAFLGSNGAFGA